MVIHAGPKEGFVLPPRRWAAGWPFGRVARSRQLAQDDERAAEVPAGWHGVAFVTLMLHRAARPAPSA